MTTPITQMRLPVALVSELDAVAAREGSNRTRLVERYCREGLERDAAPVPVASPEQLGGAASGFLSSDEEAKSEVLGLRYRCPDERCEFRAGSSTAVCPSHGRRVCAS